MEGDTINKSNSLESLAAQTEANVSKIKNKLNEVINIGKDYDENITSPLSILLRSKDIELLTLVVKTIAELTKDDEKRKLYAQKDIVHSIIDILRIDITSDRIELVKQCFRALGNICCNCDEGRSWILQCDVSVLIETANKTIRDNGQFDDITLYFCKSMINFALGGIDMSSRLFTLGILDCLFQILEREVNKDDMNDDLVQSALLIISVINDNAPEVVFDDNVVIAVISVLRETANLEISDVCLDVLHSQSDHESIKTLMAQQGVADLLFTRLEVLVGRHAAGRMSADDAEVKALVKKACDLLVIILTGDEAMKIIYNNGDSKTFQAMVRWFDSPDYDLLATSVLAVGNLARLDTYCVQMMQDHIFDKLLDIFDTYNNFSIRMSSEPNAVHPINPTTVVKIQHAVLSALRNLAVPEDNKRAAAVAGRAAPMMINALPTVEDYNVAYKLLAAIRMLVDGQESVARLLSQSAEALSAVVRWGRAMEFPGASGEAPRLIAWTIRHSNSQAHYRNIVQVDGCIECLVNMLVSSHSLMQNEAIIGLTLLAISALSTSDDSSVACKESFKKQIIKAEIGKHIAILVDTNCSKMPVEEAENLLAFLDITVKMYDCSNEYVDAKVPDAISKLKDTRNDLSEDMQQCICDFLTLMHGSIPNGEA